MTQQGESLVTVRTYSLLLDAQLAHARLEGSGITAYLADDKLAAIDPFLINAIGGIKLKVRPEDEATAQDLLARPLDGDEPADDDAVDEDADPSALRCPKCDSEYVFAVRGIRGIVGLGSPTEKDPVRCKRCDYEGAYSTFAPGNRGAPGPSPVRGEGASVADGKGDAGANGKGDAVTDDAPRERPPVFRLERGSAVLGAPIGFAVGIVGLGLALRSAAQTSWPIVALAFVWMIVCTRLGRMAGRRLRFWVCSDPNCRGRIENGDTSCAKCGRTVGGTIAREGEHFVRVAEWRRGRGRDA